VEQVVGESVIGFHRTVLLEQAPVIVDAVTAVTAVAVLLTRLHLGVKGIVLGPAPPAFVTPNVFKILQERYDLRLTGDDAQADLRVAVGA